MDHPPRHPADAFRSAARIYVLVSEFVAPILLGLLMDWGFGTAPWATVIGVLLGLTVGGFRVVQLARKLAESDHKPRGANPP
jgi:F0F1-type ATP synthase assembly protein I